MHRLGWLLLVFVCAGCASDRKVIIGFGIVCTSTNYQAAVVHVRSVGIYAGRSVTLGYLQSVETRIGPTATNILIEIKK